MILKVLVTLLLFVLYFYPFFIFFLLMLPEIRKHFGEELEKGKKDKIALFLEYYFAMALLLLFLFTPILNYVVCIDYKGGCKIVS